MTTFSDTLREILAEYVDWSNEIDKQCVAAIIAAIKALPEMQMEEDDYLRGLGPKDEQARWDEARNELRHQIIKALEEK